MRTTIDIDPDILERLRLESARRRVSVKQLLNTALRNGLAAADTRRPTPYVMPTFRMGAVREGVNLDKALAVSDQLYAAEVVVKIERRK